MKISAPIAKAFNSQQGFIIASLVAIFVAILVFFLIPRKYSPSVPDKGCNIGDAVEPGIILEQLPAIKDVFMPAEADFSGGEPIYGGPDPVLKADYVLVRKNVPVPDKDPKGDYFLAVAGSNIWPHTVAGGEIPQRPGYEMFFPSRWGEIDLSIGRKYVRNMGFLMFANKDPKTIRQGANGVNIYSVDFYQDKRIFEDTTKNYTIDDIFKCREDSEITPQSVMIPSQEPSQNHEQLQLEWFVFTQGATWPVHCKPAIYLYPPKEMLINVKVYPAGTLIYTDPQYDSKNGWTVDAYPDGKISTNYNLQPKTYPYLYFESKVRDEVIKKPTKGWVIQSESSVKSQESSEWFGPLHTRLETLLPQLGLNEVQIKDFVDYWKKALPYSPYYFVGIIDQSNVDQIERLEITPKPDSINRVRIYFERLDTPKQVESPVLEAKSFKLQASSFNVVEWGGMVKNDPNHPFTCSQ